MHLLLFAEIAWMGRERRKSFALIRFDRKKSNNWKTLPTTKKGRESLMNNFFFDSYRQALILRERRVTAAITTTTRTSISTWWRNTTSERDRERKRDEQSRTTIMIIISDSNFQLREQHKYMRSLPKQDYGIELFSDSLSLAVSFRLRLFSSSLCLSLSVSLFILLADYLHIHLSTLTNEISCHFIRDDQNYLQSNRERSCILTPDTHLQIYIYSFIHSFILFIEWMAMLTK